MEMKRLFLAINFPAEVKTRIMDCVEDLKRQSSRGNFSREENLHLTLAFIGETDREADIIRVLDSFDFAPFSLSINKLAKFAHNRGDIYWLGVEHNPALIALQNALANSLNNDGFLLEDRPFRPHITLGREIIAHKPQVTVPQISISITQLELMQSVRQNGTMRYLTRFIKQAKEGQSL